MRDDLLPEVNCYYQQYLFRNPNGYCGIGGTNVSQTGLVPAEE